MLTKCLHVRTFAIGRTAHGQFSAFLSPSGALEAARKEGWRYFDHRQIDIDDEPVMLVGPPAALVRVAELVERAELLDEIGDARVEVALRRRYSGVPEE